jgi:ABC-type dipeptide/oligopeptide/nickel transport system ATPase component
LKHGTLTTPTSRTHHRCVSFIAGPIANRTRSQDGNQSPRPANKPRKVHCCSWSSAGACWLELGLESATWFPGFVSPLELRGQNGAARADELLARVGLQDRAGHYPAQLSGGEQQRIALARAFSIRPRLLFADEPTGNLDAATGARIIELMAELNRELHTTLVLVTHDPELAARARRVIRLHDGSVVSDSAAV